jgi:hypothetical protein
MSKLTDEKIYEQLRGISNQLKYLGNNASAGTQAWSDVIDISVKIQELLESRQQWNVKVENSIYEKYKNSEFKVGDIVEDNLSDLGEGKVIDIYINSHDGNSTLMLTVDFSNEDSFIEDLVYDRLPSDVSHIIENKRKI